MIDEAPLVSVVVATNRVGPFLVEALESVAAQSRRPLEVVVVDDGSPDPAAVDRAAAAIPGATVLHQPPSGVSRARNAGAARSSGALLVFLDDDDRWNPRRIELQERALRAEPAAPLGYCGLQSIDENGAVVAPADQFAVRGEAAVARRQTGIILPNVMIRRTAFDAVGGFDTSLSYAEDLDLVLRLARLGDFVFTPETLVDYRAHAANTTARYRALWAGIDQVTRSHRADAVARGASELVAAHDESLRANARYAWWAAARAARAKARRGRLLGAAGDLGWAVRAAPAGLVDGLTRRFGKRQPLSD